MSQGNPMVGADKSGLTYRTEDNDGKKALLNHHKGPTEPSYAEAGIIWLDDAATPWLMKMHDGTDWITVGEVNATTNNFAPYIGGALLGDASTTVKGLAEIATQTEVDTGTDTTKYVTPETLAGSSIGGKVLGHAYTSTSAMLTTTSIIPADDTVPQNTEGAELLTLAYTPKSATSKLTIEVGTSSGTNSNNSIILGLFKDSDVSALATAFEWVAGGVTANLNTIYEEVSGSTTARTYKLRVGGSVSATITVNGSGGSRWFGGVAQTFIKITETEV